MVTRVTADIGSRPPLPVDGRITVDFGSGGVSCLVDSGTDISVVKPGMLPLGALAEESAGISVTLKGAFGETVSARLVNLQCRLIRKDAQGTGRVPVLLSC